MSELRKLNGYGDLWASVEMLMKAGTISSVVFLFVPPTSDTDWN